MNVVVFRLRSVGTTDALRRAVATWSLCDAQTAHAASQRIRQSRSLSSGTLLKQLLWGTFQMPVCMKVSFSSAFLWNCTLRKILHAYCANFLFLLLLVFFVWELCHRVTLLFMIWMCIIWINVIVMFVHTDEQPPSRLLWQKLYRFETLSMWPKFSYPPCL